jgi:hypothetical protein
MKKTLQFLFIILTAFIVVSCSEEDNGLAPYVGSPPMSKITVEQGSFRPKITWLGGYASVVGINRGSKAAFDSTLVWLVHRPGNNIKYPVQYGVTPEGAENLTAQFGGTSLDSLVEDNNYTFWVMKEDAWTQISSLQNKEIRVDSSAVSGVTIRQDTILIAPSSLSKLNQNLDNYINIFEISSLGRGLGIISIIQTDTGNSPVIEWTITQAGVTETSVAAMGIVEGNQYDAEKVVWEIYSEETVGGLPVYGKKNVINPPVNPWNEIPETFTFKAFPEIGLERNKGYYVWIAHANWNGNDRLRITPYYSYATFKTR